MGNEEDRKNMGYLAVVFASVFNATFSVGGECYNRRVKQPNPFCYTLLVSAVVFFFFLSYGKFSFFYDPLTFITGAVYGICYCMSVALLLSALRTGYVSLVSLIMAYSLLIPTLFGIFFYRSYPGALFYAGLALLIVAVFLIGKKDVRAANTEAARENSAEAKAGRKKGFLWVIFALLAMLSNGAASVLQTYQQTASEGLYRSEFMMVAMIVVFVFSAAAVAVSLKNGRETVAFNFRRGWWIALLCGVANAALNLLVMISVKLLAAQIVFSTICGVSLVLTFSVSLFAFREKLNKWQIAGFFVGLISTIIMNI